jgi:RNA polymerase subunit RPABC4/transcription elongation factor Spt4
MPCCEKNCPGCGMMFSPDPRICPVHAFNGWREDVEFADDPEGWQILQRRKA